MIEDLIHNSEESRTEILQILNALNDEEFTATPLSGGWSISQVINHLITAETGTIKYISKKKLGAENLKNAGVRSQFNAAALKLALKTNKRFKAPSVLSAPENTSKENCLTAWDQCRKSLYLLFTDLDKSLFGDRPGPLIEDWPSSTAQQPTSAPPPPNRPKPLPVEDLV